MARQSRRSKKRARRKRAKAIADSQPFHIPVLKWGPSDLDINIGFPILLSGCVFMAVCFSLPPLLSSFYPTLQYDSNYWIFYFIAIFIISLLSALTHTFCRIRYDVSAWDIFKKMAVPFFAVAFFSSPVLSYPVFVGSIILKHWADDEDGRIKLNVSNKAEGGGRGGCRYSIYIDEFTYFMRNHFCVDSRRFELVEVGDVVTVAGSISKYGISVDDIYWDKDKREIDNAFVLEVTSATQMKIEVGDQTFTFNITGVGIAENISGHAKTSCHDLEQQALFYGQEKLFNQRVNLSVEYTKNGEFFGDISLHQVKYSKLLLENGFAKLIDERPLVDEGSRQHQEKIRAERSARINRAGLWQCQRKE